jgi:hypothetical protein
MTTDGKSLAAGEGVQRQAKAAYAQAYRETYANIQALKASASAEVIKLINETRKAGLLLLEWREADQMAFPFWNEFLRANKGALPETLTMAEADSQIRVARASLEGEVKELARARTLMQLTFQAVGIVQVEARMEPQSKGEKTPFVMFMEFAGRTRERLDDWVKEEPPAKWDWETRQRVKKELEPMVEFYRKL